MKSPLKPKDSIHIGNYLVGFFDLLGHEESMKRSPCIFQAGMEQEDDFESKFIPCARNLVEMAGGFEDVVDKLSRNQPHLSKLMESNPQFTPPPIAFVPFSDGLLVYSPFNNQVSDFPTHSVSTIVAAAGLQQLYCLAKGIPWRGGIELCWGIEVFENHLTGKAIQEAVLLEKAAQFPRVLVGKTLLKFLMDTSEDRGPALPGISAETLNSNLAVHIRGMLTMLSDGTAFIDYLSDAFLSGFSYQDLTPLLNKATSFASSQIKHWSNMGDCERVERYRSLLDYLLSRDL